MSSLYQISDLENHKLCQILDLFSYSSVLGDYNDRFVYINEGNKVFRLERKYISPDIHAHEAVKHIELFEER